MKRGTVKFEDGEKEIDRHSLIHPWAQVLTPLVRVVALFETLKGGQGKYFCAITEQIPPTLYDIMFLIWI